MTHISRKAGTLIASGLMAATLACAPLAAYADVNQASSGDQTGSGQTELRMVFRDAGEHSGTNDPTNPNRGDGYGQNIAFSVPASINYVVSPDGKMTGPTGAYIENLSQFAVHVSSLDVDEEDGWHIVESARTSGESNAVDFEIGPEADLLRGFDYLDKDEVSDASAWNMTAKESESGTRVNLTTLGNAARLTTDIATSTKFGTLRWYLTPGAAS